jgi:hypothetical protein
MKGFRREHEGKLVRIEFIDGAICEGELSWVMSCNKHAECCGIIFNLQSSNRPEEYQKAIENSKSQSPAIWAEMASIKSFEVLELQPE